MAPSRRLKKFLVNRCEDLTIVSNKKRRLGLRKQGGGLIGGKASGSWEGGGSSLGRSLRWKKAIEAFGSAVRHCSHGGAGKIELEVPRGGLVRGTTVSRAGCAWASGWILFEKESRNKRAKASNPGERHRQSKKGGPARR